MAINSVTINGAALNANGGDLLFADISLYAVTAVGSGTLILPPVIGAPVLYAFTGSGQLSNYSITTVATSIVGEAPLGTAPLGNTITTVAQIPAPIQQVITTPNNIVGQAQTGFAKVGGNVASGASFSGAATTQGAFSRGRLLVEGLHTGGNNVLAQLTATGAFATAGNVTVPAFTASGSALFVNTYGVCVVPQAVGSGSHLTGNLFSGTGAVSVVASGTLGVETLLSGVASMPVLSATGSLLVEARYTALLVPPVVAGTGNTAMAGGATLQPVTATATLQLGSAMSGTVSVGVVANGTINSGNVLSGNAPMRLAATGAMQQGVVYSASTSLLPLVASSTAVASASFSGGAAIQVAATGALSVPTVLGGTATVAALVSFGSLVTITASTGRVFAVNLSNMAVTAHTVPDKLCAVNDELVVADGTGIHALRSNGTDNGVPIQWYALSRDTDFGTHHRKRVSNVWFGGNGTASAVIATDDAVERRVIGGVNISGNVERRIKIPKGIRSVYFQVGATGIGGVHIDRITIEPEVLGRRVR